MQCGEVGYLGNYFLYQESGKEFSTLHLQQEKTKNEKNNFPNCVIKKYNFNSTYENTTLQ